MNASTKFPRSFLKWLVAVLAVGNLILLFVFDYQIPGLSHTAPSDTAGPTTESGEPVPGETSVSEATETTLQLHVPAEALTYNGEGSLNLMDGVTVTDAAGTELTDIQIFSSIKAGTSRKEKIIEYSATDADGNRITAERALSLGNDYTGPTIDILGEIPVTPEEELSSILSTLVSNSLVQANDGFGKDITASIISSVKSAADESGNVTITLSVTNMVNDSHSIDVTVPTTLSGPILRLTDDKVTLNVGDVFSFYNYIDSAQDENGNDLSAYISMNGTVDTSTPGEYVVEFFCTDTEGNISPVKTLTVTVQ